MSIMTEQQEHLVLQIIVGLGNNAMTSIDTGHGEQRSCRYCDGCRKEGYYDHHSFEHEKDCIVLLINKLRSTMTEWQGQ